MSRGAALQGGSGKRMYGVCLSVYEVRLLAQLGLISDTEPSLIVHCCC
jgi:hypothetical protein